MKTPKSAKPRCEHIHPVRGTRCKNSAAESSSFCYCHLPDAGAETVYSEKPFYKREISFKKLALGIAVTTALFAIVHLVFRALYFPVGTASTVVFAYEFYDENVANNALLGPEAAKDIVARIKPLIPGNIEPKSLLMESLEKKIDRLGRSELDDLLNVRINAELVDQIARRKQRIAWVKSKIEQLDIKLPEIEANLLQASAATIERNRQHGTDPAMSTSEIARLFGVSKDDAFKAKYSRMYDETLRRLREVEAAARRPFEENRREAGTLSAELKETFANETKFMAEIKVKAVEAIANNLEQEPIIFFRSRAEGAGTRLKPFFGNLYGRRTRPIFALVRAGNELILYRNGTDAGFIQELAVALSK